jgi:hypothetical protein
VRWVQRAQEFRVGQGGEGLFEVGVSYSRKDKDFVHRLHDALTERSQTVETGT